MDYLPIFIGVTMAAVVLQALILVAMYLAMRKTSARMEALATEVSTKVLPTAETAHAMLLDLRPKIENILGNVSETSNVVKAQMDRLDVTLNDVIDRTRLQVIRADEFLNRTLDQVEDTTELVTKSVISPVRQLSGLIQGLTTGFEVFLGGRRRRRDGSGASQDDEMFI
jgi:hypothetical protein